MSEDTHPAAGLTPQEQTQFVSLRARSLANARWSKLSAEQRREATQKMRDAKRAKLLATVGADPQMFVAPPEAKLLE